MSFTSKDNDRLGGLIRDLGRKAASRASGGLVVFLAFNIRAPATFFIEKDAII